MTTDRKSLKQPDEFSTAVKSLFDRISNHSKEVLIILGGLFVIGVSIALLGNYRDNRDEQHASQLFKANQVLEAELRTHSTPPAVSKADTKPDEAKAQEEALEFKPLAVDKDLSKGVAELRSVINQAGSSKVGFEAQMTLGDLYFKHGEAAKAIQLFKDAYKIAPNAKEKKFALYALGYAQEDTKAWKDAISSYEEALKGDDVTGLKGDLLLAIARCYEGAGDLAKAKASYDQTISQVPNTEQSKTAEMLKARLE